MCPTVLVHMNNIRHQESEFIIPDFSIFLWRREQLSKFMINVAYISTTYTSDQESYNMKLTY